MDMIIRIFYGNYCKDISLKNLHEFVIGSRTDNGFEVPNSDMEPEHIKFIKDIAEWKVQCLGKVYLNGKSVNNAQLLPSQLYVLSKRNRISLLILGECVNVGRTISLKNIKELPIGRNEYNSIILNGNSIGRNHAAIISNGSEIHIVDKNSTNGTYVNGKRIDDCVLHDNDEIIIYNYKFIYINGNLDFYGDKNDILVKDVPKNVEKSQDGIVFKRSPRLQLDVPIGQIEIQAPPAIGNKPETDKLSIFLPILVTVSIAIIMAIVWNPMMLIYTLPMQVISGFMSYRNHKKQTKSFDEKERLRLDKYTNHLENVTKEIERKRKEQLSALVLADPEINECFNIVNKLHRRLWERRPSDSDFMNVRLGSGEIDFSMKIQTPRVALSLDEDELRNRPQEIYDKYNKIQNAPITRSMIEYPICGVVGNRTDTNKLIKNMVVQIATHHCYTEVKVVTICDEASAKELNWIKELPHSKSGENSKTFMAKTKAEADAYFKEFDNFFKKRKLSFSDDNSYGKKTMQLPFYIFVITAPNYLAKNNPMTDHLFRSKGLELGIGVIFAVEDIVQLPPECELIVDLTRGNSCVYNKNNVSSKQVFAIDSTPAESFAKFAHKLMPIYCEDTNTKNVLPTKYSFFEMIGIKSIKELDIEKNWKSSDIRNSVAAPLGIYGQNDLLYLDLLDHSLGGHGSHGLVAGKAGSGKSEAVLSYLLALATTYSPLDVQFVMIDFKGGSTANRFDNLPHLNAKITNINTDGKEMNTERLNKIVLRSLACIRAESLRRQTILSEAGAKDIVDYIEKYRLGKVSTPLPHLVLFMDEFAELKQDYPEFMKEVVSTARIGRGLGMHLILATQSPAGVVDDQIWDNSNFKLSLAVLDESNSNAVLKSPEAAYITNPGRGYLKVGNGTLFEMFQSGFGGIKTVDSKGNPANQMDATINYIKDYCQENNIPKLPSICLPPLPDKLIYDRRVNNGKVGIGIYDDPDHQSQGTYEIDVFNKNTMIIGSSQSGKTNLLQNIIRGIASTYSPDEVSMYIIDFSSMLLKNFEALHHVGGVVTSSEDEKLKNLFKLLNTEVENRKEKQLSVGVSSFAAYKEAGHTDMPQIIVLIDNLTALQALYFQDDDMLLKLCMDASTYGITFVIANAQTARIGYKYLAHFPNRIALYCNDSSEYSSLFEHCRERIENIPGRCLTEISKQFYECQTYLAFSGKKEIERASEIKKFIEEINARYGNNRAATIPTVPKIIEASSIESLLQARKNKNFSIMLGMDYTTVETVFVELSSLGMIGISGKEASGKHNFIKYVVHTLDKIYPNKSDVYILDGIRRKLSELTAYKNVRGYEILAENAKKAIAEIENELERRYKLLAERNNDILDNSKLILLVINSTELLNDICVDTAILEAMRNITGKYKNMGVCVIIGNIENKNIPYGANELLKRIKDDKHILFFDDLMNLKIFDVPLSVIKLFKKRICLGDCYYMKDSDCKKIKSVLNWKTK